MTVEQRIAELVDQGATMQLAGPYPDVTYVLAHAAIMDGPSRLRWCPIFPEHQGHVHETPYNYATLVHDRDVAFYQGETLVGYIAPYEESTLEVDSVIENLAAWRQGLEVYDNKIRFLEFFENA